MASNFLNLTDYPNGLRRNNPGNVRPLGRGNTWLGQTGKHGGFAMFKDVSYGIRAMARNARTQILKNGKDTVIKYITSYAPPKENNTYHYINLVANTLGLKPTDKIPFNSATLFKLIRCQMQIEIGGKWSDQVSDQDIAEGISKIDEA